MKSFLTVTLVALMVVNILVMAPPARAEVNYADPDAFFVTDMNTIYNYVIVEKAENEIYVQFLKVLNKEEVAKLPVSMQSEAALKFHAPMYDVRESLAKQALSINKKYNAILNFNLQYKFYKNAKGGFSEGGYEIKAFGTPAIVKPR
ncbi:MAG: hypothetical protein ACYDHC_01385 [Desulfuromonadaceae bacterium]